MPQFSYRARDAKGGLVEGVLNVADRSIAIRQIEQQNCTPIRIEAMAAEPPSLDGKAAPPRAAATQNLKVPHGQLLIFTEQLGHLLQAGMTLDESLGVLEKRLKHPRVQQMTSALHQSLIDGRSFSQALRDFPRILPPPYLNMFGAGEARGALPDILSRVVQHPLRDKNLRDRVQQALIYQPSSPSPARHSSSFSSLSYGAAADQLPWRKPAALCRSPTRILLGVNHLYCHLLVALHSRGPGCDGRLPHLVRSDEGRMSWTNFVYSFRATAVSAATNIMPNSRALSAP